MPRTRPAEERFWEKVDTSGDCLVWVAALDREGYGSFQVASKTRAYAHRWAYMMIVGPVPEGLELDHLCRTRACVRPDHLEPVTHAENMRRSISGAVVRARMAALTHCANGHEFTETNTVHYGGHRSCRECRLLHRREWWARRKAAA